jgi:hypothetical protein
MAKLLERETSSNEREPRAFDPTEISFLNAEADFLSHYLDEISSSLGLGQRKFLVLRDSTLLLGMLADRSRALLLDRNESFQESINQLS